MTRTPPPIRAQGMYLLQLIEDFDAVAVLFEATDDDEDFPAFATVEYALTPFVPRSARPLRKPPRVGPEPWFAVA